MTTYNAWAWEIESQIKEKYTKYFADRIDRGYSPVDAENVEDLAERLLAYHKELHPLLWRLDDVVVLSQGASGEKIEDLVEGDVFSSNITERPLTRQELARLNSLVQ